MRKHPSGKTFYKITVKVMKDKERPRKLHRLEENKDTATKCNVDPETEKGH